MSAINLFHLSMPARHGVAARPSNCGPILERAAPRRGLIERLADWADRHPAKNHRLGSWEQYCQAGSPPY